MQDLEYDEAQAQWVARGAAAVEALQHSLLRVRPPGEPVPRALLGTAVGEVFGLLVRMNDGDFHARHRPAVAASARRWSAADVDRAAAAAVRDLWPRRTVNALLSEVPVQAMARLFGVGELDGTVAWVHDFTRAIAPGAPAEAVGRGEPAARALMDQGAALGLDAVGAANRIALMQQSLDATAGLFGHALAAWTQDREPPSREWVAAVARRTPAIVFTRRFAAEPVVLAGQRLEAGQGVLVMLQQAPFGSGPHACPGEALAIGIVAPALACMHAEGWLQAGNWSPRAWQPVPNAHIPVFSN